MAKKLKIGQKVEASVARSGGKDLRVIGTIVDLKNDFGRDDIVIQGETTTQFVVSRKNVKLLVK